MPRSQPRREHPIRCRDFANWLERARLNRLKAGDYFARRGFGPCFLHSTGRAYKGGPNSGVFLQITCGDKADVAVPGQKFTFGVVKAAQARGDFQVPAGRKRPVLQVHLHDLENGLPVLQTAIAKALS